MPKPTVLLINPYIYDFAAYDLWLKPLGLLYLAGLFLENQCEVILLDGLDRWQPDVLRFQNRLEPKSKKYGDGAFCKERVAKPAIFAGERRYYCRYGMPAHIFEQKLVEMHKSRHLDLILVTSSMSYWYQGAHEAIALCKKYFPNTKVALGGIYATLYPDHARKYSGADWVCRGEGEQTVLSLAVQELGIRPVKEYHGYDDYPLPAYHLYPRIEHAAMMTSRGCPYNCSFCGTHQFTPHFQARTPDKVVAEIVHYAQQLHVSNIAFYDDALFANADGHIKPILRQVIARGLPINFHTPNGLFAKFVDQELARLLVQSGFKTIRLSYESKSKERQSQMRKVTDTDLSQAIAYLQEAGFPRHEVTVYLLMGLPHQTPEEVAQSLDYVHSLGARSSLSLFSPIPETPEFAIAVRDFGFPPDDPLAGNKSIYPMQNPAFRHEDFDRLKARCLEYSKRLLGP